MTDKKKMRGGSDYLDKKQSEDYERQLEEADPNYKENAKIDKVFAVDDDEAEEPEELSFIDKIYNVWDAYTED